MHCCQLSNVLGGGGGWNSVVWAGSRHKLVNVVFGEVTE
jgi:hypothetical protein